MAFSFPENTELGDHNEFTLADGAYLTFPDGDWTLAGWVKLDDNTGNDFQYFASWNSFAATSSIQIYFGEDNNGNTNFLLANIKTDNATGLQLTSDPATPGTSTAWQHIVLIRSGDTITLYADNVSMDSGTNASFDTINWNESFHLGARSDNQQVRRLGGDMAEWACWSVALTASERAALLKGFAPSLVRPSALKWYVPMIRQEIELLNNPVTTSVDMTIAPHPNIIYPSRATRAGLAIGVVGGVVHTSLPEVVQSGLFVGAGLGK